MYLVLENNMLNLVDPMDRSVLHSQPIASIRVWGVGRDNGRSVAVLFSCPSYSNSNLGFRCSGASYLSFVCWHLFSVLAFFLLLNVTFNSLIIHSTLPS